MLGLMQRRVLSGAAALVASGSMLFVSATESYADGVDQLAPLIPAAVTAGAGTACALTGVETAGVGCLVAGVGLLAVGAWVAYGNYTDIMAAMSDPGAGQPSEGQPSSGSVYWRWSTATGSQLTPMDWSTVPHTQDDSEPLTIICVGGGCSWPSAPFTVTCETVAGGFHTVTWNGSGGVFAGWGFRLGSLCNAGDLVVQAQGDQLSWKAGGSWDNTRSIGTTVTCKTPGGGTSTVTASSVITGAGSPVFTIPACPTGTYTSVINMTSGVPGGGVQSQATWAASPTAETTYANCFSGSSPGLGGCRLAVTYRSNACSSSNAACQNWYTLKTAYPADYGCLWGPYTLPLSSCTPLRYGYVPGSTVDPGTQTIPNPAASPSPTTAPGGGTFPSTGPNPLPSPSLSASGWVQPQPFPQPTGTATPVPEPPPLIGPTPGGSNCMDAAWGWNPVNWVVVPVECALTWAFVPDQAVVQQTKTEMTDAWDASGTGTFVTGAWSMLAPLGDLSAGDSGACGITVAFPYATGQSTTLHLLDACTAPMSTFAPWVKGFLTAMVLFEGVYAVMRALGLGFGISMPGRGRGTVE